MNDNNKAIQRTPESEAFNLAQREAQAWAASSIIPATYRGNVSNVLIAMEIAKRIGASALAVMQNLYIVHGNPSFGASFLIATVNGSGRFTPIRYRMEGTPGKDDWGCRAYAEDKETGEECLGPAITVKMAKGEGWWSKKDKRGDECSKWQTMPELMLYYRAAAFWTRVYCPELSMGMHTAEEMEDIAAIQAPPAEIVSPMDALTEKLRKEAEDKAVPDADADSDGNSDSDADTDAEAVEKMKREEFPDDATTPADPPRDIRAEMHVLAERLWPGESAAGIKHEADKLQTDVDKLTDDDVLGIIGKLSGQLKGAK